MSLFNELKRRNVIRVAMAYIVGAWLIIQVVEPIHRTSVNRGASIRQYER